MNAKRLKKRLSCTGCGDAFWDYGNNYDYCENCAINNNRYAQNQCPECGDGSGWIQFPNQTRRACKTCAFNSPANPPTNLKSMTKLHKYPKKNFTCDACQTALKNAVLYSPAASAKNLRQNKTYCAKCAEQFNTAPAGVKKRASKTPSTNQIIHVCPDCQPNSTAIITQQAKQRAKLISVYKQLGGCLEKIFHPIKHPAKPTKKTQKK